MTFSALYGGHPALGTYPADPNVTFEAGQVAQFQWNDEGYVELTVSDGTRPCGLIDDDRTTAYTAPVIREEVILSGTTAANLDYANWQDDSWHVEDVNENKYTSSYFTAVETNGLIARTTPDIPANNYDPDGGVNYTHLKVWVTYRYSIPGYPGSDSTLGSGNLTVWFKPGTYRTSMYDTTRPYQTNDTLYVGSGVSTAPLLGYVTNEDTGSKKVGYVVRPPTSANPSLDFYWQVEI